MGYVVGLSCGFVAPQQAPGPRLPIFIVHQIFPFDREETLIHRKHEQMSLRWPSDYDTRPPYPCELIA